MAKQAGNFFIDGTIDDLTFYKMYGVYYVRMKSSLTGKKFWKHKAFERSRESCKRFAEGNKLASKLYRHLEKEKRQYKLFCFLKKRAILLLKEGKGLTDAEQILNEYLIEFGYIKKAVDEPKAQKKEKDFSDYNIANELCKIRDLPKRKIESKNKTGFMPVLLARQKSLEFESLRGPLYFH
ncbi:MAG TPA: hypothetical protein VNT20_12875 [Flavisolibacter sp.]|jgi:hypothetical protein|nr:hypothetical protein [Flavisolibacter sp.]